MLFIPLRSGIFNIPKLIKTDKSVLLAKKTRKDEGSTMHSNTFPWVQTPKAAPFSLEEEVIIYILKMNCLYWKSLYIIMSEYTSINIF